MAIEIVDFPIENGGSFHSYVNVYQRVTHMNMVIYQWLCMMNGYFITYFIYENNHFITHDEIKHKTTITHVIIIYELLCITHMKITVLQNSVK